MTFTDYLIDIALIAIVLLQVRGRRLTVRNLVLPVAICVWAATQYLHGIPTAGNDLLLVSLGAGAGVVLGTLTGAFTRVTAGADGSPLAKAGATAAILWVAGVGTRFGFQFYATHGGAGAIGRFSAAHAITSSNAWVAALLFMAFGEVLARTALVAFRGFRVAPEHFLGGSRILGNGGSTY
ncbi:MAG: hypothetical protein ACYCXN_04560 [Acidimicrobiales bacterium]